MYYLNYTNAIMYRSFTFTHIELDNPYHQMTVDFFFESRTPLEITIALMKHIISCIKYHNSYTNSNPKQVYRLRIKFQNKYLPYNSNATISNFNRTFKSMYTVCHFLCVHCLGLTHHPCMNFTGVVC